MEKLIQFYKTALKFSEDYFNHELEWIEGLKNSDMTDDKFFTEYIWVVLCSGFSVKGARKIMDELLDNFDLNVVKHPLKRKAIEIGLKNYKDWFKSVQELKSDEEKLSFLKTLPHIGDITKYHLAKNIGLDVAKPDVHLTRVASGFGFNDVQDMCQVITDKTGDEKRKVDQVLWRYCEQHPKYLQEIII